MDERKLYEIPAVEVTHFELEDILTTSGDGSIQLPDASWGE